MNEPRGGWTVFYGIVILLIVLVSIANIVKDFLV